MKKILVTLLVAGSALCSYGRSSDRSYSRAPSARSSYDTYGSKSEQERLFRSAIRSGQIAKQEREDMQVELAALEAQAARLRRNIGEARAYEQNLDKQIRESLSKSKRAR